MKAPIPLIILSLAPDALQAQSPCERKEFKNQSAAEWKITLVEGARPNAGRIRFINKFTGREARRLEQAGDSFTLAPGSKFLIEFAQNKGYCYHDFIIEDRQGNYAEFLATVVYLSDPEVSLQLAGRRVGAPLDRASEQQVLEAIEAALRTDRGNLVIVQNQIGPAPAPPSPDPAGGAPRDRP